MCGGGPPPPACAIGGAHYSACQEYAPFPAASNCEFHWSSTATCQAFSSNCSAGVRVETQRVYTQGWGTGLMCAPADPRIGATRTQACTPDASTIQQCLTMPVPTATPTAAPATSLPSSSPTAAPSSAPPTPTPTSYPTAAPTSYPTAAPTETPTANPPSTAARAAEEEDGNGGLIAGIAGAAGVCVVAVIVLLWTQDRSDTRDRSDRNTVMDGEGARAVDNATYEGSGGNTDGFGFPKATGGDGYLEVAAK